MNILFISDLHLDPSRPQITEIFLRFLAGPARRAGQLYILGDLFESWIGDDHVTPLSDAVANGLATLAKSGTKVFFMAGNRDFLLGEAYAARAQMLLLTEPTVINLSDQSALLVHGDAQCTDDVEYQKFRARVRDSDWQQHFLAQRIDQRLAFAEQAREGSKAHTTNSTASIMDVNATAIDQLMTEHQVQLLIHGHTHRPAQHKLTLSNGQRARRVVLADWYQRGSALCFDQEGASVLSLD